MKKQILTNLAFAAIFLIAGNLTAQPRSKHKEPWELAPGKSGNAAPARPNATPRAPANGPKTRSEVYPATTPVRTSPQQTQVFKPAPGNTGTTMSPGTLPAGTVGKPSMGPVTTPANNVQPTAGPGSKPGTGAPTAAGPHTGPAGRPGAGGPPAGGPHTGPAGRPGAGPHPGPAVTPGGGPHTAPGPVVHPGPGPGPKPGPVVHPGPGPGPKPGPVVHPGPGPGPKPGPVVHPGPGPHPGPNPHVDNHHHGGGFFDRLFEPAPPRPRGYRSFPHRHPASKFTFLWYDYLPGGRVYEIKDYVIYECRYCHLVHYSPIIPPNQFCPAVPGQIHSYQILGYYGDFAFRCATCGVTINSNAVPNVGYCGAQYHIWQQLLEY